MGFSSDEIQDSLMSNKYDEVMATYLLLDEKRVSRLVKNNGIYIIKSQCEEKIADHVLQICRNSACLCGLTISSGAVR